MAFMLETALSLAKHTSAEWSSGCGDAVWGRRAFIHSLVAFSLGAQVLRAGEEKVEVDRDPRDGEQSGALVIAGGGPHTGAIDDRFLDLQKRERRHIVVIPTASARADDSAYGLPHFWRTPPEDVTVDVLHTRSEHKANDPVFCSRLDSATGVWIAGGNQGNLEFLRDTLVHTKLKQLFASGCVVGGTSAGAAFMSDQMIRKGDTTPEIGRGLGLLNQVVDMHFTPRQRRDRLLRATEETDRPGLGIDEGTALIVRRQIAEVIGAGNVHFFPSPSSKQPSLVLHAGDKLNLKTGVLERRGDGKSDP